MMNNHSILFIFSITFKYNNKGIIYYFVLKTNNVYIIYFLV